MRKRRALILGLGRFGGGSAAAHFLSSAGHTLRIADRAPADELRDSVQQLDGLPGLEWRLGREDLDLLDEVDLLVCNPAIRPGHPLLVEAAARGIAISQEINLFLENYPGTVCVVTGTNGKSSTATLLAAALRRSGVDTLLGGNIGHSLLTERPQWRRGQVAVLELSSFQLERVDPARHRVAGAVFTPLGEDHLDWHGDLSAYRSAKGRAAAMAVDFIVRPAGDEVVASYATDARCFEYARLREDPAETTAGHTAGDTARDTVEDHSGCDLYLEDNQVRSRLASATGPLFGTSALTMLGRFQVENAMAAFAAAIQLGGERQACALALTLAAPLPHRLQLTTSIDGVDLFDNAVSTQLDSTLTALDEICRPRGRRVHWVGGGKSKDQRYARPGRELSGRVATAHLFGAAAIPLASELGTRVRTSTHIQLEDALHAAWTASRPGDAVLFSPAFASFDQFPNFKARAARFDSWVRELRQRHQFRHQLRHGEADG